MKTQTGIAFAPDETPELLDVYQPDDGGKRAAVLMLHGGGWRVGSRADLAPHAEALARRGFTAVVADYRLMPAHPWPAQIRDTRAAIKWIRDNADALGIEPDRIVGLFFRRAFGSVGGRRSGRRRRFRRLRSGAAQRGDPD